MSVFSNRKQRLDDIQLSDKEREQISHALWNRKMILEKVIAATEGVGLLGRFSKTGRTNSKCQAQMKIIRDLLPRFAK